MNTCVMLRWNALKLLVTFLHSLGCAVTARGAVCQGCQATGPVTAKRFEIDS